jgi:hypothetical protein
MNNDYEFDLMLYDDLQFEIDVFRRYHSIVIETGQASHTPDFFTMRDAAKFAWRKATALLNKYSLDEIHEMEVFRNLAS